MNRATIDIGSNSVRLLLSSGKHHGNTTRLAAGLKNGALDEDSMRRTAEAVAEFVSLARQAGDEPFAFATSAVRDASNGPAFARSLAAPCRILSGEEEALVGYLGASRGGECGLIDVGGASTEIAVGREGSVLWAKSLPFGAVRCTLQYGLDVQTLMDCVRRTVEPFRNALPFRPAVWKAVGGTCTTLAAIRLRLVPYKDERVENCPLSQLYAREQALSLAALPLEEKKRILGLEPKRADILHSGCAIFASVLEALGIREALVTTHDNLEGYRLLLEREENNTRG